MNIIKKAGMMLVVAVMLASCFFMEYYTYQSQETLLQMQKGEIKEQEKVVTNHLKDQSEKLQNEVNTIREQIATKAGEIVDAVKQKGKDASAHGRQADDA